MKPQTIEEIIRRFSPAIERGLEITQREYEDRWARVQAAMKEKGYDLAYA